MWKPRRKRRVYSKRMAEENWPVKVYIYDISKGMARSLSQAFIGKQINGVWHTGIVAYGQEYYFGGMGGIESCRPGGTVLGQPDQIEHLGTTQIPKEMFHNYLLELGQSTFRPHDYHLLEHNCNNFSSEVAQFLTGQDIPSHITSLPAEVMSTPLGQMIKPLIDTMSVQPSGGHSVFSQQELNTMSSGSQKVEQAPVPPVQQGKSQQGTVPEATAGNSLPGSANSSRSDTSNFDPSSEEETDMYEPYVYTEPIPDLQTLKDKIGSKLTTKNLESLDDMYEYLSLKDKSQWSLGKDHIQSIHTVIGDGRMGDDVRVGVYKLLQSLVLFEDFITLLQHEPTEMIKNIVQHYDQLTDTVHTAILKLLTNLTSTQKGQEFVMTESEDESSLSYLTSQFCINCILSDKSEVNNLIATAVYNLCRYQIPEAHQIEIGSAVLECLQRDLSEQTAFHLLTSLLLLMKNNAEMCDLASIVGMNCSQHEKLSPRVKELCSKAQEFSAL
ncbi:uncharacterized protein LOC143045840 isoform X1 [Mytilus galloprovincialis]|uniref:uncharacterized protein LOC143045840 isoform X1 n=2 Tax=Mytilus galloprovincialis TaxID=29158 RepID=UPI003F7C01EC